MIPYPKTVRELQQLERLHHKFGMSVEEIAKQMVCSIVRVECYLSLLELPLEDLNCWERKELTTIQAYKKVCQNKDPIGKIDNIKTKK